VRILTRYILKEVLSHALIGVAVFTFVIFMRDMGRILELVVRNSAPLSSVLEIFLYTFPTALTLTIPMGVLVGILIGLSRLAADSEITAMRSIGMGVSAFVWILGIFVVFAWALATFNNTYVAPRSAAALTELQERLKTSQASFEIQPRVFYEDFPNVVLYVQDSSTAAKASLWRGVFLADVSTPGAPKITLAKSGLVISEAQDRVRLHLLNGFQHDADPRQPQQYSVSNFLATDIPVETVPATPQVRENAPVVEVPTADLLPAARKQKDPADARQYLIEFHRRLSLPAACIVLALVGIPLGLSSKKGGKSTGFVLTIALVMLYYIISLAGISLARQGKVSPAAGVWLATVVFLIGGMLLLWRLDRLSIHLPAWRANLPGLAQLLGNARVRSNGATVGAFERASRRPHLKYSSFPTILDGLILRDFLFYLGLIIVSFLLLMEVFTFFELLKDIVRNRVPLVLVADYLLNLIPYLVYNLLPMSVLLAVLVTFGLMQKSSEITAMKATGISVYRTIVPILVIAATLATALFVFDQFYLPQANKRQDSLRNRIKGKAAQTYLRPERKWIFGESNVIYYYEFFDPDQNHFASIQAFEVNPQTLELKRRIYANNAQWDPALHKWVFKQGWVRSFAGNAIREFRTFDVATFPELEEQPGYFKKEVKQSSEMNYGELLRYIGELQQSGFDVVRLRVQLQKKFAFPVITFVMAVLAIPYAFSTGRHGALAGIATAVGIAVVYWVASGLFEAMGNTSQLPPLVAAWSPDVIFALAGGYMVLKVPT
jgi:LPS export ABC transporter permease LptF/LPS export ABC transporter permease LptG